MVSKIEIEPFGSRCSLQYKCRKCFNTSLTSLSKPDGCVNVVLLHSTVFRLWSFSRFQNPTSYDFCNCNEDYNSIYSPPFAETWRGFLIFMQ